MKQGFFGIPLDHDDPYMPMLVHDEQAPDGEWRRALEASRTCLEECIGDGRDNLNYDSLFDAVSKGGEEATQASWALAGTNPGNTFLKWACILSRHEDDFVLALELGASWLYQYSLDELWVLLDALERDAGRRFGAWRGAVSRLRERTNRLTCPDWVSGPNCMQEVGAHVWGLVMLFFDPSPLITHPECLDVWRSVVRGEERDVARSPLGRKPVGALGALLAGEFEQARHVIDASMVDQKLLGDAFHHALALTLGVMQGDWNAAFESSYGFFEGPYKENGRTLSRAGRVAPWHVLGALSAWHAGRPERAFEFASLSKTDQGAGWMSRAWFHLGLSSLEPLSPKWPRHVDHLATSSEPMSPRRRAEVLGYLEKTMKRMGSRHKESRTLGRMVRMSRLEATLASDTRFRAKVRHHADRVVDE